MCLQQEMFRDRVTITESGDGYIPLVLDIRSGCLQLWIDESSTGSSSICVLRFAPRFLLLGAALSGMVLF